MDVTREDDGHWHFRLGPVERKAITVVFVAFTSLVTWLFLGFAGKLQSQGETMNKIVTQQAVTNQQLQTLSSQLSDVPGLTRQIAELQVTVARNSQDIHDLQQVRAAR